MDYLYEAKSIFNKVKHAVLNLTEMESKVMDATNDDKWGASSTLMLEIAKGTFHFQQFNEIMNIINKRLTEREPSNWRHIYKALTLLEYLIKNGSEKVVDYSRSHISVIKSLRNFHYIDEKGKDQGVNVKNRSKEIVELLGSTERIKEERKKAKANRSKYVGIGSEPAGFGSEASGSGFGGFSSGPSYSSSGIGTSFSGFKASNPDSFSRSRFDDEEEENKYEIKEEDSSKFKGTEPPLPPLPSVDLLSLDDPVPTPAQISKSTDFSNDEWSDFKSSNNDNDDFGDFQSVSSIPHTSKSINQAIPPLNSFSSTSTTTTKPVSSTNSGLDDLLGDFGGFSGTSKTQTQPIQPTSSFAILTPSSNITSTTSNYTQNNIKTQAPGTAAEKKNDIWSEHSNLFSLDSLGFGNAPASATQVKPSMAQMKQNLSSNAIGSNNSFNLNNASNFDSFNTGFQNLTLGNKNNINIQNPGTKQTSGLSNKDLRDFDSLI